MSDPDKMDEKPLIPGLSLLEDEYSRGSDDKNREQYAFLLSSRDASKERDEKTSRSSSRSGKMDEEDRTRERYEKRSYADDRERSSRYDEMSRESTKSREKERYEEDRSRTRYEDERSRDRYDDERSRGRDRQEEDRGRERERYDDRSRDRGRFEDDRGDRRPSRFEQAEKPRSFEPILTSSTSQMEAEPSTSGGFQSTVAGYKRKQEFGDDRQQFKKKGGIGGKGGRPPKGALKVITPKEIFTTKPVDNVKQGMDKEFRSIHMQTNYFNIIKKPHFDMVQYRVDFYPHVDLLSAKKNYLKEMKETLGGYIFDGTCCFLARKLPYSPTEVMSKTRDGKPQKIVLKEVAVISMTNQTSVQLLNLILRKALEGLKLQLVGRNFFDAAAKIQMRSFRLELWPGYITSIRQHEHDILLCAEIAHKVMRNENVYDILQDCYKMAGNWKESFMKKVIGTTVLTDYNNKTYRIDDIDFNQSPATTFDTKSGPESFVDYYMRKYGIKIRDSRQPLLISKSKMKDIRAGQSELIALIPELCRATGFTDEMRNDFKLMKAVSEFTRLTPNVYKDRLQLFNERLHSTEASVLELNDFNLKLDRQLVEVDGHICPKNQIFLGNNQVVEVTDNADWNDALKSNSNNSMYSSKKLTRWIVLCPIQFENEARNFIGMLRRACDGMKYVVIEPRWKMIPNDRIESYNKSLDEFLNLDPQLVFCVVPNNRADRYSAIKKKCCIGRSVATQVILTKTINPRPGKSANLMSVATKVAIQLNCKMGGAPWMLPVPLSGLMSIGFDVYHDSRDRGKSYGAMVATMDLKDNNPENVKFYSCVTGHRNGEELSNSLSNNITMALKEFKRQHEALPQRIMFYRDGVGDGQIEYIHNHEVQQLKNQIAQVYKSLNQAMPKFCYIIVNKRINARLFSNNRNPPPGTVVDDVITLPERYDFYLVSQSVRQGTAAPTAYNIITDTLRIGPARMQMLTYRFTHLYYNWSGTIRVPAVCQYAHRLAYLTGQYLHGAPSNGLERQLYFL